MPAIPEYYMPNLPGAVQAGPRAMQPGLGMQMRYGVPNAARPTFPMGQTGMPGARPGMAMRPGMNSMPRGVTPNVYGGMPGAMPGQRMMIGGNHMMAGGIPPNTYSALESFAFIASCIVMNFPKYFHF